jgi:tetratricopeptide (TPR) repeat protein
LLEVAPNYVWAHFEMAQIYEQQGQLEEAAQESLKADELFGTDAKKVAQLKEAIAKSGARATGGVRLKITESLQNQTTCHQCWWQKRVCGLV